MNRKRRWSAAVAVAAAVGVSVVAVALSAATATIPGVPARVRGPAGIGAHALGVHSLGAHAPGAPWAVVIHPDAIHIGAAASRPSTTAQCEQTLDVACYGPGQLRRAYNLWPLYDEGITGKGQTIVIVESYGSPTIEHDLAVFDAAYHLSAPPSLTVIQPAGAVAPYKATSNRVGWAGETNLDVEYAHAMAPGASILLVETPTLENEGTSGFPQIVTAEEYVIDHHLGGVISQSFSATEQTFPSRRSLLDLRAAYIDAAEPANDVTVLAAAGDFGATDLEDNATTYYDFPVTSWPDSDPLVTGIGGTGLHLDGAGSRISPDTVWNDTHDAGATGTFGSPLAGGGGKSIIFARPAYQNGVAKVVGTRRGVPDISMSADCDGTVEVYQSFAGQPPGWYELCGTSEATPLFAGVVALADEYAGHPLGLINPALYAMSAAHAPGIVDITKGNNTVTFSQGGKVLTVKGFPALPGYDLASGVGTVNGAEFVPELVAAVAASSPTRPLVARPGLVPRTRDASLTTGSALTSVNPAFFSIADHADIETGRSWNRSR
jgi:subtilase family serine protease